MKAITGNLRMFLSGAVLSYRALFRWFRPGAYFASKIFGPLMQMIFFTLIGTWGGVAPARFFVIGNAMQIAAVSGIYGVTMSIGGDRWEGTLAYLFGSPANRLVLFFGRAVIHILDGMIGVAIAFLWGFLLFGLRFTLPQVGILFLVVFAAVFATSGMGLLMGCIGMITRNVMFVNNTIYFLLLFLAGSNVPVSDLPSFLQRLSACVPLTHAIAAARLVTDGSGFSHAVAVLIGQELLIGVAYLLAGYLLFSRFEKTAKRIGSLETM